VIELPEVRMKILEVMHALETAYELYGDIIVDICEHSAASRKHYWCTSVVSNKDVVSISFHKDGRYKKVE
jgi:hypothetical protein